MSLMAKSVTPDNKSINRAANWPPGLLFSSHYSIYWKAV
jgi:hypothetical protein